MRGSRLPGEWTLPDRWRAWALGYVCPYTGQRLTPAEAAVEAEKFADHWHSVPGQRGVKLDWRATWRNWVRKAAREMRPGRDLAPPKADGPDTALWDEHDAVIREATRLGIETVGVAFPDIKAAVERARSESPPGASQLEVYTSRR